MRHINIDTAIKRALLLTGFLSVFISTVFAGTNPSAIKDKRVPVYHDFVQKTAEPIGGLEAIVSKIEYPPVTRMAKMEGRVIAKVYVDEKGYVDDVEIVKGVAGGCREAVESAIRRTRFTPAFINGRPVRSKAVFSVKFSLRD